MSVYRKLSLIAATFWLTAQTAFAAGGGDVQSIVIVADSRKLTGIMAWWANLYNESHFYFTLLTVILIPLIGVIFGVAGRHRHALHRHRPLVPRPGGTLKRDPQANGISLKISA